MAGSRAAAGAPHRIRNCLISVHSAYANYAYDMDAIKKAAKAKAMSMGVDAMKNPEVQKKVKEVVIDQVKKDPKAAMEAGKKIMKEAMKK